MCLQSINWALAPEVPPIVFPQLLKAGATLLAVTVLAAMVPALRAAALDPIETLRAE
jgi:ABC-type lipoprotein release transport system permease subunit